MLLLMGRQAQRRSKHKGQRERGGCVRRGMRVYMGGARPLLPLVQEDRPHTEAHEEEKKRKEKKRTQRAHGGARLLVGRRVAAISFAFCFVACGALSSLLSFPPFSLLGGCVSMSRRRLGWLVLLCPPPPPTLYAIPYSSVAITPAPPPPLLLLLLLLLLSISLLVGPALPGGRLEKKKRRRSMISCCRSILSI